MAKKRPPKPVARRPAKPVKPIKKAAAPDAPPSILVLYELRDQAGMVRYHSEHADPARAQMAARTLVSSPDIAQAWILRGVEIVRASG